jgi:hypothetical protein
MAGARIEEVPDETEGNRPAPSIEDVGENSPILEEIVPQEDDTHQEQGAPEDEAYPDEPIGEWQTEASHYQWDDEYDEGPSSSYRVGAMRTLAQGYATRRRSYVARYVYDGGLQAPPVEHNTRVAAGVVDRKAEPMYDHRARKKDSSRPKRPRDENETISIFWEINGTRAHCLLDSGCEGVMMSPDFARATGIKTFSLERPISLQMACIGSRSVINYGARATIKIANQSVDEYFDIANVDYYDVIIGTPLLRRLGMSLDFKGQGSVRVGNIVIPNGANSTVKDRENAPPMNAGAAKPQPSPRTH